MMIATVLVSVLAFDSGGGGLDQVVDLSDAWRGDSLLVEHAEAAAGPGTTVVHAVRRALPDLGREELAYKVFDASLGATREVVLSVEGRIVDGDASLEDERAIRRQRRGGFHPEVLERIATMPPGATTDVLLWIDDGLDDPVFDVPDGLTDDEEDAYFGEIEQRRAERNARVVQPIATELQALGAFPRQIGSAPVLTVTVDAPRLLLAERIPGVTAVSLDARQDAEMNVAHLVVKAPRVWNAGIDGQGVKVAVVDVGGRAASANPYLTFTQKAGLACSEPTSHTTAVAGIIRSSHDSIRGIAPASKLWVAGSCNGFSTELFDRIEEARAWGARVINLSWGRETSGIPDVCDRLADEYAYRYKRMIFKSAGNTGSSDCGGGGGAGWVSSPGLAYNIVTVGAYRDAGTEMGDDDSMDPCSSWKGPKSTNGDREKPELVAPGRDIRTTLTSEPWVGGQNTGTSMAAPIAASIAALVIDRKAKLKHRPEALKAIIMASATHNIQGVPRLSRKDGAGGVRADRADDIANGRNGGWKSRSYGCDDADLMMLDKATLVGGRRTRIVIAWANDPSDPYYEDRPAADLDLIVRRPNGSVVDVSAMFDNTYEIVDFEAPTSGTFSIEVSRVRCDRNPERVGLAWYQVP